MAKGNGKVPNTSKTLEQIVEGVAELRDKQKALAAEIKELAGSAWAEHGIAARAVKQLAEERRMGDVAREKRRQYEEQLQTAREALGMLFDTPLGQAAAEGSVQVWDAKAKRYVPKVQEWDDARVDAAAEVMDDKSKKPKGGAKGAQRKKSAGGKKKAGAEKGQPDWPI
jgi:uncharacterized protein (UPF0335 family)